MKECEAFNGGSCVDISDFVKNLKLKIDVQMYGERKRQEKAMEIAEKMYQMSHNLPNILKTIYNEDK